MAVCHQKNEQFDNSCSILDTCFVAFIHLGRTCMIFRKCVPATVHWTGRMPDRRNMRLWNTNCFFVNMREKCKNTSGSWRSPDPETEGTAVRLLSRACAMEKRYWQCLQKLIWWITSIGSELSEAGYDRCRFLQPRPHGQPGRTPKAAVMRRQPRAALLTEFRAQIL